MGKQVTHICDRCGKQAQGEDFPWAWRHVHFDIRGDRGDGLAAVGILMDSADLCQECVDSLRERVVATYALLATGAA